MAVTQFRPYKVRKIITETDFIPKQNTEFNRKFAKEDLAKSGLTIEDMVGYDVDNLILPEGATAGYLIPYWDLNGGIIFERDNYVGMYRTKLQYPLYTKAQRYSQPSGEQLASAGLPSFFPYLYPCKDLKGETIYCCEGEKKTASFVKHLKLPAFGIAGCNMWGNPNRTGGLHPWILEYLALRGIKKVVIIPDGDVFKYDICTSYGTYANALIQAGYEVELLNPPDKIDDLIVRWGGDAELELSNIPRLRPDELVQSPVQLATLYDLSFKRTAQDKVIVHQNTSNIMKLMRQHPAFPEIWLDRDTNKVMFGEKEAVPNQTEMEIANHIQHNFGMDKVTDSIVIRCIKSLSRENERSPMLAYIQGVSWDGVKRLDTWLTNYWGVEDNAYTREVGSKWLTSACARMAVPGSKVDWIFIAVGPQGTGKTSMPGILFRGNSTTLYGDHDNKDLHLLLHSALVVGFDELDSFTRKDTSLLKAMITTTQDMFRPPYGASVETFQRRFTLYGCGNRYEFLQSDPSGQRRYAIVEVPRLLDFKRLEADRDQLWAEAWARYTEGKTEWWEVKGNTENSRKHEIPNLLHEKIDATINKLTTAAKYTRKENEAAFTMTELFTAMDERFTINSPAVRDAAAYLRSIGLEQRIIKVNGTTKRVYVVQC